jgi:hypothetical protein
LRASVRASREHRGMPGAVRVACVQRRWRRWRRARNVASARALVVGRRRCRRAVLQRSAVRRPRALRDCGELCGRALRAGGSARCRTATAVRSSGSLLWRRQRAISRSLRSPRGFEHDHSQGSHRSPRSPVGSRTSARYKAPGHSSCSAARMLGDAARLPAPWIRDEGELNAGGDRCDRVYDGPLCRHFRRARRAIARRPTRKLMNTDGVARDVLLVVGAGDRDHDRGDDRESTTARRLVNGGAAPATSWPARSRGWCRRRGR